MSCARAFPDGGKNFNIVIVCTEEQEEYIKSCGCIASDDDICDCNFCGDCAYGVDKIEFRRE